MKTDCAVCGARLAPGFGFCAACGAALDAEPPRPESQREQEHDGLERRGRPDAVLLEPAPLPPELEDLFAREDVPLPIQGLVQSWRRNRAFFDRADGLGGNRSVEMALRRETDAAVTEAASAARRIDRAHPFAFQRKRRIKKAFVRLGRAMERENHEYRASLRFRDLDPNDDEAMAEYLRFLEMEEDAEG